MPTPPTRPPNPPITKHRFSMFINLQMEMPDLVMPLLARTHEMAYYGRGGGCRQAADGAYLLNAYAERSLKSEFLRDEPNFAIPITSANRVEYFEWLSTPHEPKFNCNTSWQSYEQSDYSAQKPYLGFVKTYPSYKHYEVALNIEHDNWCLPNIWLEGVPVRTDHGMVGKITGFVGASAIEGAANPTVIENAPWLSWEMLAIAARNTYEQLQLRFDGGYADDWVAYQPWVDTRKMKYYESQNKPSSLNQVLMRVLQLAQLVIII